MTITKQLDELTARLQRTLGSRVRNLELRVQDGGLVVLGSAQSYHAKQLAQHHLLCAVAIPLHVNAIEVSPRAQARQASDA